MRKVEERVPWVFLAMTAVLLLAGSGLARAQAVGAGTCVPRGEESVTPDSLRYSPGNVSQFVGSGFAPSCSVRLDFRGPDEPGSGRLIKTDPSGGFSFTHGLGNAFGKYRTDLTGKDGAALSTVFVTVGSADLAPSIPSSLVFTGNFGTADHGAGFSSSLIIPNNGTTTGAAVDSNIIVAFSSGPANRGGPVGSCTDTQNNTYTLDVNLPSSSSGRALAICSARVVNALGPADAITIHFPTNGNGQHATANVFAGLAPAPALDQTHTASGNSNAPNSGATAMTSQDNELLIGAFAFNGTNFNALTAGGNFALTNPSQGGGTNTGLGSEYRVVSSKGQYFADGSLKVATAWMAGIATYKVGPGPATHFQLSAPPNVTAGNAFNVSVTALDASNAIATGYTGTVHFTSSDTRAVLPADFTFTAADAGVHIFSVTLKTAPSQTVTATDTADSSITGSATIAVLPSTATHLEVTAPSSVTAGNAFTVTVRAQDAFNNQAAGYLGTVHFTKSDSGSGSAIPADYTFLPGDFGVHVFINGATLVTAGNQTITATDTSNSSITGSASILVNPSSATHFAVSEEMESGLYVGTIR